MESQSWVARRKHKPRAVKADRGIHSTDQKREYSRTGPARKRMLTCHAVAADVVGLCSIWV